MSLPGSLALELRDALFLATPKGSNPGMRLNLGVGALNINFFVVFIFVFLLFGGIVCLLLGFLFVCWFSLVWFRTGLTMQIRLAWNWEPPTPEFRN